MTLIAEQNVETSEHVIGDGVKAICSGPDNFCLKGKPSELQWCIVVPGCKMSSNNGGRYLYGCHSSFDVFIIHA